jgi:hypothetical protein
LPVSACQARRPPGRGRAGRSIHHAGPSRGKISLTKRELRRFLDAQAIKRVQIHYALKAQGYKVIAAAKRSFNLGIADFAVKLRNI